MFNAITEPRTQTCNNRVRLLPRLGLQTWMLMKLAAITEPGLVIVKDKKMMSIDTVVEFEIPS